MKEEGFEDFSIEKSRSIQSKLSLLIGQLMPEKKKKNILEPFPRKEICRSQKGKKEKGKRKGFPFFQEERKEEKMQTLDTRERVMNILEKKKKKKKGRERGRRRRRRKEVEKEKEEGESKKRKKKRMKRRRQKKISSDHSLYYERPEIAM
jgi:hypothetical protein